MGISMSTPALNIVYGYLDPRDGQLRYVGKSSVGMKRPRQLASHGHWCGRWISSLATKGIKPKIVVLEALASDASADDLNEAEVYAIAKYRRLGCDLTNITNGGDGVMGGRKLSEEHKAKIGAASKRLGCRPSFLGHNHTPEAIEKIRASKLGHAVSAEARAKIGAANRLPAEEKRRRAESHAARPPRRHSAETREKLRQARLRTISTTPPHRHSPESIEKMRLARWGSR